MDAAKALLPMRRDCSYSTLATLTSTGSTTASDAGVDSDDEMMFEETLCLKNTFFAFVTKRPTARSSSAPPTFTVPRAACSPQRVHTLRPEAPVSEPTEPATEGGCDMWIPVSSHSVASPPPQAAPALPPPPMEYPAEPLLPPPPAQRACEPGLPVLRLASLLGVPELGSKELPTRGSQCHQTGNCKPCAFAWKAGGCNAGVECQFCHLCLPGERRRRKKQRGAEWSATGLPVQAAAAAPARLSCWR